jgi:hypothetical protein
VSAFDITDLRRRGFGGFVPVAQLEDDPPQVPPQSGVYAVVREASAVPRFLERSDAGWWRGKDPNVPVERLAAEWVEGAQTLYIGDAASLRERVGELVKFSRARGESVRHYGGRLLWQLDGCQELLVAWKEEPFSTALEYDLLEEFIEAHDGRLPFANLQRGKRYAPRPRGPRRMSDDPNRPGDYFTGMPEDIEARLRSDGLIEEAERALPELRRWLREHRGFKLASFELVENQPMRALVQAGYRDWLLLWRPGGWERVQ